MATLKQIRDKAKEMGVTIEVDDDCQCYRAAAADRQCWEPGLHELVSVFGGGIIGNGATRAEAKDDLFERLVEYQETEECEDHPCDWCDNL